MFSERSKRIVAYLERVGGATSLEVALYLGIDRISIAGSIGALERRGIVFRGVKECHKSLVFYSIDGALAEIERRDEKKLSEFTARRRNHSKEVIESKKAKDMRSALSQNFVFSLGGA